MNTSFTFYSKQIKITDDYGNLTELFKLGNANRLLLDLPQLNMNNYLKSERCIEIASTLEDSIRITKGRHGMTSAHYLIMLDAAGKLSSDFRLQMLQTILTNTSIFTGEL